MSKTEKEMLFDSAGVAFLGERYYVTFASCHRSCICRLWRWCTLLIGLNVSSIFLHHVVAWTSGDLDAINYNRRRRPPPPPT